MHHNGNRQPRTLAIVRCAVYTRKSTEEGLEQEFNTLDAQRESAEAFIKSQAHEGWTCVPDRYDDGGFTGGNLERPALQRLLLDIAAGKVDCVVVYKVDRLSRSLLDFARLMETFEAHKVSFVSVTQQFNSATSMGRLVLNVLLSFAQFEREIISERTRDKIAATRRRGKWSGGPPLLGYDIDARGTRLVVNEDEAVRVRAIFQLYLEHQALLPVVHELGRRGWTNKRWQTRAGHESGGGPITKTALHRLLTNVVYAGKVRYKSEIHDGEHPALVDTDTWRKVQALLQRNGRSGGGPGRNTQGFLLKGLLRCAACGCGMTPSHTRRGNRRYRYYVCTNAQKNGWDACPSKSVPAAQLEGFVVEQVRCVGRDPDLFAQTVAEARAKEEYRLAELEAERRILERDLTRWHTELRTVAVPVGAGDTGPDLLTRLADLQDRIQAAERRTAEVRGQVEMIRAKRLDEDAARETLAAFDPLWQTLAPQEQARVVDLLVRRVDYDGGKGSVAITFHPTGIKALADELASQTKKETA
jgi:site-specific DNA recombinase